jgi:hypothetical protein
MGEVTLRTICRRGHVKEPSGRCKECERLTYERRVAARRAEGLTARGRPRYSLRTHCLRGHLRSDNEVRRTTNGTPYCRACNLESMRRHRQRIRESLLIHPRRLRLAWSDQGSLGLRRRFRSARPAATTQPSADSAESAANSTTPWPVPSAFIS